MSTEQDIYVTSVAVIKLLPRCATKLLTVCKIYRRNARENNRRCVNHSVVPIIDS